MGIFGALSTAVSGLRAQSFALENISGNIANSQTTGFKRIDTDFLDLIPDAPQKRQTAGSVLSQSRSTNTLQGDIRTVSTETNMAINGNGFFVVEPRIGQADGDAVFSGSNFYTRRGDFELDKGGYLVNGAGYYLKGLPIDPVTQNISGSVPQVLRLDNAILPASQTTRINYQLNLPQLPKTAQYQESKTPGSQLLDPADFMTVAPNVTATLTGAALGGGVDANTIVNYGETLTVTVDGAPVTMEFFDGSLGAYSGSNVGIDVQAGVSVTSALAAMQTALRTNGGAAVADATINLTGGNFAITLGTNMVDVMTTSTTASGLGIPTAATTTAPTLPWLDARVQSVAAKDADQFIAQSISGGAITVYAENGAPTNLQLRWAKVNSTQFGGSERWNLFYLSDADATGSAPMWTNVDPTADPTGDYVFGGNGSPSPAVEYTQLNGLTVNGVLVGDVRLQHGANGLTQFADPNGTAEVTALNQNGYGAGEFVSVAVNDNGRVVVSYNNGQQLEVAQVVTANFNAANQLKRMDGGVFAATSESGEPILNNDGGIIGASLEASNTDISEEFTKLIVTQQAYAAGTRIVSTADEMLQEALNMVR
ncbi:flagellar hook protein FlgE [Devosia sp.]|uniref:flagellar hook protein FlgE n=1 Tax=Devosia sp. TaxID=1871048 RepID=UPI002F00A068